MEHLHWTAVLSVGVQEFDEQHKMIIAYINMLDDSFNNGSSKLFIGDILDALFLHTAQHFAHEEHYFDLYNYPGAEQHKFMHSECIKTIYRMKKDFSDHGEISESDRKFVGEWLISHIKGVDQMYSVFFNDHGLK